MTDPDYNPWAVSEYSGVTNKLLPNGDHAHFSSWKELMTGYASTYKPGQPAAIYWPGVGTEIYWDVFRMALAIAANLPNGDLAWKRMGDMVAAKIQETGKAPDWNIDPTWAVLPRNTVH
jgi:hypothetical protein